MAPKNDQGSKRKLPSRSKDSTSKKPKYEKRPPPPPADEEDSITDDDDFGGISDQDNEGDAQLNGNKAQKNVDRPATSKDQSDQAEKAFERGNCSFTRNPLLASACLLPLIPSRPNITRVPSETETTRPRSEIKQAISRRIDQSEEAVGETAPEVPRAQGGERQAC